MGGGGRYRVAPFGVKPIVVSALKRCLPGPCPDKNPSRVSWEPGKVFQLCGFPTFQFPFSFESAILLTRNHVHPCLNGARLSKSFPMWEQTQKLRSTSKGRPQDHARTRTPRPGEVGGPEKASQLSNFQISKFPFSLESVILLTQEYLQPCCGDARLV